MDRGLQHAEVLLRQGRADLAERSLREHLAGSPEDGRALALLGLSLVQRDQYDAGLAAATSAAAIDPDEPLAHYVRALGLNGLHKFKPGLEAAQEVIRLAPDSAMGFSALASIRSGQRRWADMLEAANAGLAVDPDDVGLISLRGVALTQLGRRDEAAVTYTDALREDPTDPGLLIGHGLAKLHESRPLEAMEAFREALRIDPTNEGARWGLVEAMKARNPLYGRFLDLMLAFSRLGTRGQIVLVVGYLVGSRVIRALAADPDTRLLGWVLMAAYLLFVWLTFAASSLFDLLLRLDPLGKHALTGEQVRQANAVGILVAIGLPAGAVALISGSTVAAYLGVVSLGLVIPLANVFTANPGRVRVATIIYAVAFAISGAVAVALAATSLLTGPVPARDDMASTLFFVTLAGFAIASWISWPLTNRQR